MVCPAILLHRVISHIVDPILLFPVQSSIHFLVRFTTCEFYMAYADYQQMMNITEAGPKRCRVASEEGGMIQNHDSPGKELISGMVLELTGSYMSPGKIY